MILQVLAFVRELRDAAKGAAPGPYNKGYRAAIEDVEEYITNLLWEAAIDDPEDE